MTYDEQAATQSILKFLDLYDIKNDQGQTLDFKSHEYLWAIYKDFSPKQVILKAAQIGFSTMANIKAFWLAKNKGMDIIYSLPSSSDIKDFVSGKTNRLIANNGIFQGWTEDKDSIEQKHIGGSVLYFRGTWTERAAIAIPADLYISDETDRSKQDIVQQYKTRLQHSKFAWEWYFSNPSVASESVGVNKYWVQSDQKHWFVRCGCGEWQYLTMENIMFNPAPYFGCKKCKSELDRRHGKWVQKYQNKDWSGYWISALMAPWISAKQILQKQKEYSEEQFYNFVLGLPYASRGNILSKQAFFQNLTPAINPQKSRPILGVDTGVGINLVVGNSQGIFYANKTSDYEEIRSLMKRWPNAICVIDQGGDIIGPRKLREEFRNRVFLCFFARDRKDDKLIRWNDEDGSVIADRNKIIQLVVDELTEKRIPIYGTEADWWDVWTEWSGMYRTTEDNALGIPVSQWNKPATGRADYPFCFVYWRIGLDRFMEQSVKFVDPDGGSFAQMGIEVQPDGTGVLPKNR